MPTSRGRNRRSGAGAGIMSALGGTNVVSKIVHSGLDTLREQARSQAGHFGEFARERGGELLGEQKDRLAKGITAVSQAMRTAADKLHDDSADAIGDYIDSAADGVAKVARFVERSELANVGRDLE